MCLIVLANRASARFPFVLAANRDEDYGRRSIPARFWPDDPNVLGGRDAREGGSWLALTRQGRIAAVTNVRGGEKAGARSRGLLVREFVESRAEAEAFAREIEGTAFAGFHLIAGTIGGQFVHASNAGIGVRAWPDGVHGISNGPPGALWPKVERATAHVQELIESHSLAERLAADLLSFLGSPGDAARNRGTTLRDELEGEVFVMSDRHGTRSSTVIIAGDDAVRFFEQNYGPGGARQGSVNEFVIPRRFVRA
jgi:uncharacterized protein with NRDE domain